MKAPFPVLFTHGINKIIGIAAAKKYISFPTSIPNAVFKDIALNVRNATPIIYT